MPFPIIPGGTPPSSGYQISRSLRLRSFASAYLSRTQGAATNGYIWTWSAWVKRGSLGANQVLFCAGSPTNTQGIQFLAADILQIFRYTGAYSVQLDTTQVFRDPSSWYHLVIANDGTQATASNRVKLYVNGSQVIAFTTATYPPQNTQYEINNNGQLATIGRYSAAASSYFDGYMAEQYFIDGQALTPSSFGAYDTSTGVWGATAYTGSYGTNGFYLSFNDNTTTLGGNLCIYSEDISNAAYTKDRSTVSANSTTAPNGTTTADSLIEDTSASNTHRYYSGIGSPTNGVTYTWSVYAKANTRSAIALEAWNGSTAKYAYADLSAGTIISGSDASAAITSVGSGWYRVSVQHTGVGSAGSKC